MDITDKRLKGGQYVSVFIVVITAIIIMAVVSKNYFSFLDTQLFEERKSHIVEFTDKASEIVDSVILYSWQQVAACEHAVKMKQIISKEELLDALASTSDFIDGDNSVVLAVDQNGGYYSSDYDTGRWPQTEMLTAKMGDEQQVVAEIPHKPGQSYFLFMKRLKEPVSIGDGSIKITHLAVAVDIETMRDKISINAFGDQCYTYLINENGRRIYKYTYASNFIEGYNVLNSFQNYNIINGGTYESFIEKLKQGKNAALEFEFIDDNGKERKWYVANSAVQSCGWQILLFVPTEVLGADTNLLMNRTITFFITSSVVVLALVTIIVVVTLISRANRRLVKQKEEANILLKNAAREANSANQAKSDFLSNMSHDIRTPINGIMGMTDIALKNISNQEKVYDCLNKISGSSQHLLGLVNDVLDMSRIESGKTKANHECFNLEECINNCISIIGGQLVTRDVEMVQEINSFEHPFLIGDELHLRQVFINILGNSVKFTPDGGKIYFRAVEKEVTEKQVLFRFELEDTGIGMKKEFLPHLFEAFAQEDDGMRTTYKGTGLGMAITKKFIDLMGGTIEVTSELNAGTKFIIELWIDIDKDAKNKKIEKSSIINLNNMKVLLVEDIEMNLEVAQAILEEKGAVITPAINGKEAVEAFAENPEGTFDVILMDIMMPVMDGLTATKTIRALNRQDAKTIPIIAVTANAYEEDIQKAKSAGMNAHLSKPIDTDKMLKVLSQYYSVPQEETRAADLAGMKILLADDIELNIEIAKEFLEEEKAVVTTVNNGKEAVDAFAGNPEGTFDVILMDVHMPVMDGLAATRTIRAMERPDAALIPILAMTADVCEEDIQKTKAAGMNSHLEKPLDISKIIWVLSEYKKIS